MAELIEQTAELCITVPDIKLEAENLKIENNNTNDELTIEINPFAENGQSDEQLTNKSEQPLKLNVLEQLNRHNDIGSGNESSDNVELGELVLPNDEMKVKIAKQVEFYFSDANILKDTFLLKHVRRNKEGYVSLKLIASFRKVKSMTRDSRVVAYCLADSEELKVNPENTKVKRLRELPDYDETTSSRTVLITNLPTPNPTVENISELVKSSGGDIVLIRIIRPAKQFPADLKKYLMKHPQLDHSVSAVIEYEKYEQAKHVVDTLTDTSDWKKGMRAILLVIKKEPNTNKDKKNSTNSAALQAGSRNNSCDSLNELKVLGKDGRPTQRRRKVPITNRRNYSDYDSDDAKIPQGNWRDHMTPKSTPSSSPMASPRTSPRASPNMRRRSTGINAKSPLTNDITIKKECSSSPNSPWVKRRLRTDTGGSAASPGTSPKTNRKVYDDNLLRHPKGPDGSIGFGRGRPV